MKLKNTRPLCVGPRTLAARRSHRARRLDRFQLSARARLLTNWLALWRVTRAGHLSRVNYWPELHNGPEERPARWMNGAVRSLAPSLTGRLAIHFSIQISVAGANYSGPPIQWPLAPLAPLAGATCGCATCGPSQANSKLTGGHRQVKALASRRGAGDLLATLAPSRDAPPVRVAPPGGGGARNDPHLIGARRQKFDARPLVLACRLGGRARRTAPART